MKVLHVSAAGERGGLEVVLLNFLRRLDRSRFTPYALFLEDGPFIREVKDTATETHVIDAGRVRQILKTSKAVGMVARLIRSQRIDLVHTWNAKAHIYGGLAAALTGVPTLYHLHGVPRMTISRDGLVSLLSVAAPARCTVACSAYVAGEFRRAWHSRRELEVVYNGTMPCVSTVREPRSIRAEFGIPDVASIIVMATRLQRWKGVHIFLDAAARVLKSHPEAFFIVVGGTLFGLEQAYALELHQQVERLKLNRSVCLAGFRSDVNPFYSAADIVVHSSIEPEPFGMVLIEAMACAKPVIASDSGGPREIVETGVTGLLVPPRDPEALAQAILALLRDPDRRVQMGRAGAARVRACFSTEHMVGQLQALYEEMLDRDSAA